MSAINTFNSAISDAINKQGDLYQVWFGRTDFTPETTIVQSSDINCGAICNELEFARRVGNYYVRSLDIDQAEGDELEELITGFINLPRRGNFESDVTYSDRFKFLTVQQVNQRRTTRWAILDALRYFIDDVDNVVQVTEQFDSNNLYFQVRFEGIISTENILFLNSTTDGYLDNEFIGGPSLGSVVTYIGELIQRIKAAGVDFDVLFIEQDRVTRTSDAFLGTIQRYVDSDATIKSIKQIAKSSDSEIA